MKFWNQKQKALLGCMIFINHPAVINAVLIFELVGENEEISSLTFEGRFLECIVITGTLGPNQ